MILTKTKANKPIHTEKEVKQIISAMPSLEWQTVALLAARAGLRRGEILNLNWQNVNFDTRQLYVAPNKDPKPRLVSIGEDLYKALKIAKEQSKTEKIINMEKDYLSWKYRKITEAAGIKSSLLTLIKTGRSK